MSTTLRLAALTCALLLPMAARAGPMPTEEPKEYDPISAAAEATLGVLTLSAFSASFALLDGTLDLEPYEDMGGPNDAPGEGPFAWRVTNGQTYLNANKGANGFCDQPIRWLVAKPTGPDTIEVSLYTIGDLKAYRADGPGLCAIDSFAVGDPLAD